MRRTNACDVFTIARPARAVDVLQSRFPQMMTWSGKNNLFKLILTLPRFWWLVMSISIHQKNVRSNIFRMAPNSSSSANAFKSCEYSNIKRNGQVKRLSPYQGLVLQLYTPQLSEKYVCTYSHLGAHFVISINSFVAGVHYEVLFTVCATQTLFCGNLALSTVATVLMARYVKFNTSKERAFQYLSNGTKFKFFGQCV